MAINLLLGKPVVPEDYIGVDCAVIADSPFGLAFDRMTPPFTPGPWHEDEDGEIGADVGCLIGRINQVWDFPCLDLPSQEEEDRIDCEMVANTRLVARSPRMYAAMVAAKQTLLFFCNALAAPSPGWEKLSEAMFGSLERTALDDALTAVRQIVNLQAEIFTYPNAVATEPGQTETAEPIDIDLLREALNGGHGRRAEQFHAAPFLPAADGASR